MSDASTQPSMIAGYPKSNGETGRRLYQRHVRVDAWRMPTKHDVHAPVGKPHAVAIMRLTDILKETCHLHLHWCLRLKENCMNGKQMPLVSR